MKALDFVVRLPTLKFQEEYPPECKGVKDLIWTNTNLVKAEYLYRDGRIGGATSAIDLARRAIYEARKKRAITEEHWKKYKDNMATLKNLMLEKKTPGSVRMLNKEIVERLIEEIIRGAVEFCAVSLRE